MAFDSYTTIKTSTPSLLFTANDFIVRSTLSKPTLVFATNDLLVSFTTTIPTISFSADTGNNIAVNAVSPAISFTASLVASGVFTSAITVKKPTITYTVHNPNIYTFTTTTLKPTVVSVLSTRNAFSVVTKVKLPSIKFGMVVDVSTTRETWVVNTITNAHSRYTNYDFNSFFRLGNKFYGVNSSGIFELGYDKDYKDDVVYESDINSEVILPASSFNEQKLKACSDGFIYGRCDGDMEIAFVVDEQEERTGFISNMDRVGMHRKRIKIPKGLKGSIWQYKIRNVSGSAFDINNFEVFLTALKRVI